MDWNQVITPAAIGALAAALVSVGAGLWNSRQERVLQKRKLFFEKAYSAYEQFDKFFAEQYHIHKSNSMTIKSILDELIANDTGYDWRDVNGTNLYKSLNSSSSSNFDFKLEIFLSLKSCLPEKHDEIENRYSEAKAEFLRNIRTIQQVDIKHRPRRNFLASQQFINASDQIANMYLVYIRNVQREFKKTYRDF